jgi:uncharacterized protein
VTPPTTHDPLDVDVLDDGEGQLSLAVDGTDAVLSYRTPPGRLVVVHTEVPDAVAGRGHGGRLVASAVRRAKAEHLVLVPWCPFARHWLSTHPDAREGLTVDWTSRPDRPTSP